MKPFDIKKFLTENKLTKLTSEVELPSAVLSKANTAVTNPKSMAALILQFIDQIDDKENPNIFKNAKLKRAVEFLKDLSDDEAQAPADAPAPAPPSSPAFLCPSSSTCLASASSPPPWRVRFSPGL